jgi:SHS2 domain-containing protein
MKELTAGFNEISHTADWEIEVWAPDLSSLLGQSALGMYHLMGIRLKKNKTIKRIINIKAPDDEGILVSFLSELLFICEKDELAFKKFVFRCKPEFIEAEMTGSSILSIERYIKAVTYHNLAIKKRQGGVSVQIVFDV